LGSARLAGDTLPSIKTELAPPLEQDDYGYFWQ